MAEEDEARAIDADDPLVAELATFFEREFLPVAARLRAAGALHFGTDVRGAASTWGPCAAPDSPEAIFAIPEVLDREAPDPEAVAAAVCGAWRPGEAAEALRPLVAKLLALGRRYPLEEALEGEVEDSVYVMF